MLALAALCQVLFKSLSVSIMATIFNNCLWASGGEDGFPCDANAVEAMSLSIAAGVFGLISVGCLVGKLRTAPRGNALMNEISDKIKSGAKAFLRTEYKYLTLFVLVFFALLLILYTVQPPSGDKLDGVRYSCSFLAGAFLSAASGWVGMLVATDANVRTTQLPTRKVFQLPYASPLLEDRSWYVDLYTSFLIEITYRLTLSFTQGFTVVGFGLLGLSIMFCLVSLGYEDDNTTTRFAFSGETLGKSTVEVFTEASSA